MHAIEKFPCNGIGALLDILQMIASPHPPPDLPAGTMPAADIARAFEFVLAPLRARTIASANERGSV